LRRAANAPGALDLDVLPDGTAYFTTLAAVFEIRSGRTVRVAGGGPVDFARQVVGPHLATNEAIYPSGVAGTGLNQFYFTNENLLYLVKAGVAATVGSQPNFFNSELATSSTGLVYGICDWDICRISGRHVWELFRLPEPVRGVFAAPVAPAVSPSGDFYMSYSDQSSTGVAGIVEISPEGKVMAVIASRYT
jgi:hypothetical protein